MCGRYALYSTDEEVAEHYDAELPEERSANYNVAPTQTMPVMTQAGLQMMRWGLIPKWAKDEKIGYKLINARSESILEKPVWKNIVRKNRCLIPANGFYEWKKTESGKIPYFIHLANDQLFSFAGIWETWIHKGHVWNTYSIITTKPNRDMKDIHDRMPVILTKDEESAWLNADDDSLISTLLTPLENGLLKMHEVSKAVNTIKVNEATLIGPINSK
jgi:putative SOS response-associated peptidase YedK